MYLTSSPWGHVALVSGCGKIRAIKEQGRAKMVRSFLLINDGPKSGDDQVATDPFRFQN